MLGFFQTFFLFLNDKIVLRFLQTVIRYLFHLPPWSSLPTRNQIIGPWIQGSLCFYSKRQRTCLKWNTFTDNQGEKRSAASLQRLTKDATHWKNERIFALQNSGYGCWCRPHGFGRTVDKVDLWVHALCHMVNIYSRNINNNMFECPWTYHVNVQIVLQSPFWNCY